MEVNVNVNVMVDLGQQTAALLVGCLAMVKSVPGEAPAAVEAKPETQKAAPAPKEEPEKPTRTRRTKEQIAADEAATANGWDDMDDDAKLEAIKSEVTKHTKKAKSADIKFMLANFEAGRASELNPADYDAFMKALARYGNGESVEDIFPGDNDLN